MSGSSPIDHGRIAAIGETDAGSGGSRCARVIAFYLPQFHPIPENDEWWGPGFTEWTNLAQGRRLFPGHVQPHIPGELGFYDLRLPETREAQAHLARKYGVEAFCYWHYWFGGKEILDRPFAEVLESGQPDFPFCLAWANQSWTGIWHGADDRILIEQRYPGAEDERRHFEHLLPAFADRRYLRVDGRPLFYIFRPEHLPQPGAFVERWQGFAQDAGLPGLHLVAEIGDVRGAGPAYPDFEHDRFDAGTYVRLPIRKDRWSVAKMRLGRGIFRWPEHYPYANAFPEPPARMNKQLIYPCVYPNWDNTPRSGRRGLVVTGSHPGAFRNQIDGAIDFLGDRPDERKLLFVKSWNEWAEGNYLEPDREFGDGYLRTLDEATLAPTPTAARP